MIRKVKGFEGLYRGSIIIVAHTWNIFGEDQGYGVWKLCENYEGGKTIKTWRYITHNQTKQEAIDKFNSIVKTIL